MSAISDHRRGRPVVFLALIVLGWTGLRLATFETPWPALPPFQHQVSAFERLTRSGDGGPAPTGVAEPRTNEKSVVSGLERAPIQPAIERPFGPGAERSLLSARSMREPEILAPGQRAVGHNVLWSAAMAQLPRPASVAALFEPMTPTSQRQQPAARRASPWRVDAWLLLRGNGPAGVTGGQRAPSYGASQLGAVLSYRLAPRSPHSPSAYLRASHALTERGESEAALGLSVRPLPHWPLTAHAEMRATRRPGGIELRPAAFIAGGFERERLPFGLRARAYAAAGYVGGDFATAFVDGQAAVDAEVARFDVGSLRAGAGAWGGAQRGAARLDLGPTASLEVKLGEVPARLSLDYRHRVAGDAAPSNGVALTLSTGF